MMEELTEFFIASFRKNGYFDVLFVADVLVVILLCSVLVVWFFAPSKCSPLLVLARRKTGSVFYVVFRTWLLLSMGNIIAAIFCIQPSVEARLFILGQLVSSSVFYSVWFPPRNERIDPERVIVQNVVKVQYFHLLWTLLFSASLLATLSAGGMLGSVLRVFTLYALPISSAIGGFALIFLRDRLPVFYEKGYHTARFSQS